MGGLPKQLCVQSCPAHQKLTLLIRIIVKTVTLTGQKPDSYAALKCRKQNTSGDLAQGVIFMD